MTSRLDFVVDISPVTSLVRTVEPILTSGKVTDVIGTVIEIWETGAHDVLVVESEGGQRHLLPTARELMPEIDLEASRIVVEDIPGLFDPA